MLAATFLAIFFIPLFFKWMTDWRLSEKRSTAELRAEIAHHRQLAERATEVPHKSPPPDR
jgi:HAE1 family hydrophobic/amphiphilic exporter-1/multidrug efflux pump